MAEALAGDNVVERRPLVAALFAAWLEQLQAARLRARCELLEAAGTTVRLVVTEGKYRMVRRVLANCGHPVGALHRERYGEALKALGVTVYTGKGGFYHWCELPEGAPCAAYFESDEPREGFRPCKPKDEGVDGGEVGQAGVQLEEHLRPLLRRQRNCAACAGALRARPKQSIGALGRPSTAVTASHRRLHGARPARPPAIAACVSLRVACTWAARALS